MVSILEFIWYLFFVIWDFTIYFDLNLLKRFALVTTVTELNAIAAPAIIGESRTPKNGKSKPAAIGKPNPL